MQWANSILYEKSRRQREPCWCLPLYLPRLIGFLWKFRWTSWGSPLVLHFPSRFLPASHWSWLNHVALLKGPIYVSHVRDALIDCYFHKHRTMAINRDPIMLFTSLQYISILFETSVNIIWERSIVMYSVVKFS